MNLKKLLFGKVENVNEFIEKSNSKILKWAFWINVAILLIVFIFLGGSSGIQLWTEAGDLGEFFHLFGMYCQDPIMAGQLIAGTVLNVIFIATLIFICVLRGKHTKELDEKFWEYKATIEADEELMKQYADCYRKRAKDFILVNGYFYAKDKNSRVKFGYKSNTVACLWLTVFICIGAGVLLFSWLLWRPFNVEWARELFSGRGGRLLFLLVIALPIFYVWYTKKRYRTHKMYVTNITAQQIYDESYSFDEGFMNYISADEKLSKLADKYQQKHSKGRLSALCATWEDALLFGLQIGILLIYVWFVLWLLAMIAQGLLSSGSSSSSSSSYSSSGSSSGSSSSSSYTDSSSQVDEPTPTKRLVLVGRGFGEYYEIDGKYIREGLGTPYGRDTGYELHGREIWYQKDGQWKTMAVISTDGSDGSVMYSYDYEGEKIFERYEWKA